MNSQQILEWYNKYKDIFKWFDNMCLYNIDDKIYEDKLIRIIAKYDLNIYDVIVKYLIAWLEYVYYNDNVAITIYSNSTYKNIKLLKQTEIWSSFKLNDELLWHKIVSFKWIKNWVWIFTDEKEIVYWKDSDKVINIDWVYYFINK